MGVLAPVMVDSEAIWFDHAACVLERDIAMAKYSDFIGRLHQRAFELALNAPPGALSPPADKPLLSDEEFDAIFDEELNRLFPEGEEGGKTSSKPLT
jgi:hypothetical protein